MKFSVKEIAGLLGAVVEGDDNQVITGLSKIEEGQPGTISFLANPRYTSWLYTTQASAVLVAHDFQPTQTFSTTLLRVPDPYSAFTLLLEKAQAALQQKRGIDPLAFISPDAVVGQDVYIGPFAYIGPHARIGDGAKIYPHAYVGDYAQVGAGTVLHPHVTIYHACRVGARCILHAGVVVGSDGFGFAPQADGQLKKIPQTGIVRIEDDVELGAGCTLDRATLGETVIRRGVKLDNLVHVAHNAEIGESTVIAAQTGISGSTRLGKGCMVGGQVGIVGHIELADGTRIGAQSGVSKSVTAPGTALRGSPAQEYRKQLRTEALVRNLEDLQARIAALEAALNKE